MGAITGAFFQNDLADSAWLDWALYTASPPRAVLYDLDNQVLEGLWDPGGFTADGSTASFARHRQTAIKHRRGTRAGRKGYYMMIAAMGYSTPEISGKLPGYLSPPTPPPNPACPHVAPCTAATQTD
eukprot:15498846-Heterocapsa_arctica.AAC.1